MNSFQGLFCQKKAKTNFSFHINQTYNHIIIQFSQCSSYSYNYIPNKNIKYNYFLSPYSYLSKFIIKNFDPNSIIFHLSLHLLLCNNPLFLTKNQQYNFLNINHKALHIFIIQISLYKSFNLNSQLQQIQIPHKILSFPQALFIQFSFISIFIIFKTIIAQFPPQQLIPYLIIVFNSKINRNCANHLLSILILLLLTINNRLFHFASHNCI
ncbi:unnamed protein product (macronuclear) [Paramecium tetraurelia]|uniref:Transmembrane protein n=1 Tax=Paramecium tetraurelia TaxID=5888 RepID=A0DD87_PARTE|nr:uncharacterized protein GSPATT00015863001 [Paramecium tetraurelia]CAK81004.1 unnamed protein product [Paramecium tetraurelia]|eukprot:XP_001448401.1 hypothetical protein (macronuclear) [Paramecium tetraurelia strain d4-2]